MKKTFQLNQENKKPERVVESIKKESKKYIARERRKELPEGFDFWDFDCKIGANEDVAEPIHLSEINKKVSEISATETETLYLEILVKKVKREKSKSEDSSQDI